MKNRIALHACYWSGTRVGESLDDIIAYTSRIRPDALELSPAVFIEMDRHQRAELRRRVEDHGLTITVNGGLMTPENDTSSPDPAIRAKGVAHCARVLEACAQLGSPYWSGLMHSAWCLKPDPGDPLGDKRRTWARAVESMRQVSRIAEDNGVVCAIELVNRYEHFLLNTAAEGVAFCDAVDHPCCRILLDVFHMSIEEDNLADAVTFAQRSGHLCCIHVGETNRRIPTGGPTNIDWEAFGAAVRDSGFEGNLVLEPLPFARSATAAKTCLWRDVSNPDDLDKLVDDGKKAVALMRRLTERG